MNQTPPQSPLAEANPRSLDELFNADPLSLTDEDVGKIVADFRNKRHLWEKEEQEAKTQGRRRKKVYKDAPAKLSLADLDLGSM